MMVTVMISPFSPIDIIRALMFICTLEVKREDYYYNHFTALWILSGTTLVSWYQKGKTNLDLL